MSNQTNLTEVFLKKIRKNTSQISLDKQMISEMLIAINKWQAKTNQLERRLQKDYQNANKIQSFQEIETKQKKINKLVRQYNENLQYVRGLTSIDDIVDHFMQGYELLHRIREMFTHQEITYSILYENKGKLIEGRVSLNQLLASQKQFLWTINSMSEDEEKKTEISNFISLRISNAQAKAIVEKANLMRSIETEEIESQLQYPQLWDSLIAFRDAYNYDVSTYNLGRLYEVYTRLVNDKHFHDYTLSKRSYKLVDALLEKVKNDKIPGWQQGDYGLTQLKAVYNSNAGLISGSSLKGQFEKIILAFKTGVDETALADQLIEVFTPSLEQLDDEVSIGIREQAIQAIKEVVQNLGY